MFYMKNGRQVLHQEGVVSTFIVFVDISITGPLGQFVRPKVVCGSNWYCGLQYITGGDGHLP